MKVMICPECKEVLLNDELRGSNLQCHACMTREKGSCQYCECSGNKRCSDMEHTEKLWGFHAPCCHIQNVDHLVFHKKIILSTLIKINCAIDLTIRVPQFIVNYIIKKGKQ